MLSHHFPHLATTPCGSHKEAHVDDDDDNKKNPTGTTRKQRQPLPMSPTPKIRSISALGVLTTMTTKRITNRDDRMVALEGNSDADSRIMHL